LGKADRRNSIKMRRRRRHQKLKERGRRRKEGGLKEERVAGTSETAAEESPEPEAKEAE